MKVLMIAPNCYPVNGAEEICNIKLLRAMTEDGSIIIDLVSRKRSWSTYPSDTLESYGVKVNSLTIVESDNRINLKTIWQTILCFFVFGITYRGSIWALVALPYVKKLLKKNKYDFVLTKNSPSLLLGSYLHKRGIKWVASWNDPSPSIYYPAPYGEGKDAKVSYSTRRFVRMMSSADAHIFPTIQLRDHMLHYMKVDKSKTWIAPHIVFQEKKHIYKSNDSSSCEVLKIIHSGNLTFPRSPKTFMIALNDILEESPSYKIDFTILGQLDESSKKLLSSLNSLQKHFHFHKPVEYKQSLTFLRDFDVACVIEADCGVGGGVFLPTKVTDFMQVGIPIMAVSPPKGVLEELYNNGAIGYFSDVSSVESIKESIKAAYNDFIGLGLRNSVVLDSFTPQSVVSVYKQINSTINSNKKI